jgi:hypothetical protein
MTSLLCSAGRALLDQEAARIPGLVLLDADERRNRVLAGVETAEGEQQVRAALGRLNIPAEAVIIERRERAAPAHAGLGVGSRIAPTGLVRTIEDYAPTVAGGYRIRWRINASYVDQCSLGFNAWRYDASSSAWQRVFTTASHCSNVRFGLDNMRYHQWDVANSAHYIGREIYDPPGVLGTTATTDCSNSSMCCPQNYRCRQADALVALWEATRWGYGQIARTLPGSPKTIDEANPAYRIAGEINWPFTGETLYKVGTTTGTTSGNVTLTCTFSYPTSDKKLLCQDEIRFAQPGDSGGPVYALHPSAAGWVYLYGTVQGTMLMSAMSNIENDLGILDTYDCVSGNPDYPNCKSAT